MGTKEVCADCGLERAGMSDVACGYCYGDQACCLRTIARLRDELARAKPVLDAAFAVATCAVDPSPHSTPDERVAISERLDALTDAVNGYFRE